MAPTTTDAFYAEERGRTREAYSTSASAVREFAVNTGVYSAEYGRAAGRRHHLGHQERNQPAFTARPTSGTAKATGTPSTTTPPSLPECVNRHRMSLHTSSQKTCARFTASPSGGPLIKDKLFWIYTYDQHTHVFPAAAIPEQREPRSTPCPMRHLHYRRRHATSATG